MRHLDSRDNRCSLDNVLSIVDRRRADCLASGPAMSDRVPSPSRSPPPHPTHPSSAGVSPASALLAASRHARTQNRTNGRRRRWNQPLHLHLAMTRSPVSRRTTLRGIGTAGIATALGLVTPHRTLAGQASAETMIEPEAGSWKTWILESGDQLRPGGATGRDRDPRRVRQARGMVADRDAVALDRISYWDAGSPGYRWNEIATQQTQRAQMGPNAYRVLALMNGAIYDATIAAWDAKYTYNRPRPAVTDAELETVIPTPNSPSYPDAHAVTAGAAATVLAYLFPDEAERFSEMATEAAESRVMAGVAYPSDIAAGLDLGREVGKLFVEYAKTDNSDAQFDPSTMPTGSGHVER